MTANGFTKNGALNGQFGVRRGNRFRFLYAASPFEHFPYKELGVYDFDFQPNFVGIFTLKGFVDSAAVLPVRVRYFSFKAAICGD